MSDVIITAFEPNQDTSKPQQLGRFSFAYAGIEFSNWRAVARKDGSGWFIDSPNYSVTENDGNKHYYPTVKLGDELALAVRVALKPYVYPDEQPAQASPQAVPVAAPLPQQKAQETAGWW